ncbi:MAG TPA: formyltransferase family protein [Pyrinomonadaceae bacterium]|nr:formyltransferase family protein [Pyrinomonadaceae bacterium]
MNEKKLKIIILTHGGAERLLELLSEIKTVEIVGVFVETATEKKRSFKEKIKRSIRYDGYFATIKKIFQKENQDVKAVQSSQGDLEKCAGKLKLPLHKLENYHTENAIKLLKETNADLGILYGTNIIKEAVFSIPRFGSINIHQGLAPIYRGGPTVFWELFNDEKELGITVHFVAPKVDTGDIILQKTVPLNYDFSRYGLDYEVFLEDFRALLKEPSAQLLAEAVKLISEGKEKRTKQDTSIGKRYKLPIKSEKDALLRVLKKRSEFTL